MSTFWRNVFSLKHEWRITSYAFFCIVAALLLSFASRDLGLVLFKHIAINGDAQLTSALGAEQTKLLNHLQVFSERQDVRDAVHLEDQEEVVRLLEQEQRDAGLSALIVSDKEGISLSKVPRFSDLGDNLFLTSSIGRTVSRGVSSVGYTPGRNFPLTLAAGIPIGKPTSLEGVVFGGYWFDDEYAKLLKARYFSSDQEVILYAKEDGVTGDSLEDLESKQLFRAYLNHASSYMKDGKSGDVISFKDHDYVVTNHLLFGEHDATGGILLLKKLPLSIFWRSLLASAVVTLLFLIGALLIERITVRKILLSHKRLSLLFLGALSLVVFSLHGLGCIFMP